MEKLLDMLLNMCRSQSISSLNTGGRVKVMVNDKKQYSEFYNKKCYTDLKNILKMSCQRNENSLVN